MTYFERTERALIRAWWLAALIIVAVVLSFCAYMAYAETSTDKGPLSVTCPRDRDRAIAAMYGCYIDERGALHVADPYYPLDAHQVVERKQSIWEGDGELTIPLTEMKGYEVLETSQALPTVGIDPDGSYQYIRVDRQGRVLVSPESGCRP